MESIKAVSTGSKYIHCSRIKTQLKQAQTFTQASEEQSKPM
jgi:hypothetical protein